jgi:hypothetical protein
MKDPRDLKDLTIHDVQPIGDEYRGALLIRNRCPLGPYIA